MERSKELERINLSMKKEMKQIQTQNTELKWIMISSWKYRPLHEVQTTNEISYFLIKQS